MRKWMLEGFLVVGLAVALVVAVFASPWASSAPDGLSRVAIDKGFEDTEKTHSLEDSSPVAGYAVEGVTNERISTGLAGAIGVAVTFAIAFGAFFVLRRARGPGANVTSAT
jgi:hypothetical protein